MRLDEAAFVSDQYASEDNLRARQSIYAQHDGPNARDAAFEAVKATSPRCILEVGGGQGELAERLLRELDVRLTFIDQSERMVALARSRGIDARVGDVQRLELPDGAFDTAVAAWMLYHLTDLDRGLGELARVLEPGGRLVAVTNGDDHLRELRDVIGADFQSTFSRENGEEALLRHFSSIKRTDLDGTVTIASADAVHAYRDSMITSGKRRDLVFDLPMRARTAVSIFVASR